MYTLKINSSEIVTDIKTQEKQLAVQFEVKKVDEAGKEEVLATLNQGFAPDISKEDLVAELVKAKDIVIADYERKQQPEKVGVEVGAEIAKMTGQEL